MRKAGNRVRISVQLVKVADGYHLWSETYDRTLDDIFAVQDDIAQSVVKELRTTLLGEAADSDASGEAKAEVARAAKGRATDPEAHRLYPPGAAPLERGSREDDVEGDRVSEAGAGAGSGVRARLGGALLGVLERARIWAGLRWRKGMRERGRRPCSALTLEPDLAEGHAPAWMDSRSRTTGTGGAPSRHTRARCNWHQETR